MDKMKSTTKIVGLIGYPIDHTLSPAMHNAAFRHMKLDYNYVPMPVKPGDIKRAVKSIVPLNITGVNVTVTYKEAVIKHLDKVQSDARLIGAVNTIHNLKGKLLGYNTDAAGFIASLTGEGRIKPKGRKVLLIGAGGVGRAIGIKLAIEGVSSIHITDIDSKKAATLVKHIKKTVPRANVFTVPEGKLQDVIKSSGLLVNATTVGMRRGDQCVVKPDWLHKKLFVYDVVYNLETKLLKEAKKRGLKTLGGLGMLVHQGALAFEIWTGKKAPVEVMRKAIIKQARDA